MKAAKSHARKRRLTKQGGANPIPLKGSSTESSRIAPEQLHAFDSRLHGWPLAVACSAIAFVTLVLYGGTFSELEYQWRTEADYSHGYLIPILSAGLLYARREFFPGFGQRFHWLGVGLLVFAVILRTVGRLFFMEFLEGWSIVPWLAGCLTLLAGVRALTWALPALAFLLFMVPLPYQIENLLSWKLQSLVTFLSATILRILGFPAIAEGNTIWIEQSQMLVEEACSGLRIFVGMAAFAFFWSTLIRRAWVDKLIVLASIIPLSIVANTVRSVIICISYYWFDGRFASQVHDWAGILMIVLAAAMVWLVKEYWERLYRPVWVSTPADLLKRS